MGQALVERRIGTARSVTVNIAESPLGWLRARGLVDARQFEAGERLRGDYERAALGPSVTMRWDAAPAAKGRRGRRTGSIRRCRSFRRNAGSTLRSARSGRD